jgi:alanine racemase
MDMIMVDIGNLDIHEGEKVEIIGKHQSIQAFAEKLETIPYEVMTGISSRVHRIFIDQ